MKKLILLIAFIAIAIMAYPQSRRSSSSNGDSNVKKENSNRGSQPSSAPSKGSGTVSPSRSSGSNARTVSPSRTTSPSRSSSSEKTYSDRNTGSGSSSHDNARVKPQSSTTPSRSSNSSSQTIRRSSTTTSPSRESSTGINDRARQVNTNSTRSTSRSGSSTLSTSPSRRASENSTPINRSNSSSSYSGRSSSREASRTVHNHTTVVTSPVVVRETRVVHHHHNYVYRPIEYRRVHYVYRAPTRLSIVWTNHIYNDFISFYPNHYTYIHLNYNRSRRIHSISAYDALYHVGEVKKVYGEVSEVYYSDRDDIYYLYIGGPFPYHDFSVIIEGRDYRRYDFPHLFRLERAHIWSMGLITEFEGKPEVLIRKPYQLGVY